MNLKFLGIGKANAEIERLEKALLDEQAKTSQLTKELADSKAALESNSSDLVANSEKISAELKQAQSDLAAAKLSISTLTTELATTKATIADPKGKIETSASQKAAEITASQGQPVPIKTAAPAGPGNASNTMKRVEFEALAAADKSKFMRSGGRLVD
jgi:ABC-type transporter Mla subunit MlaD